MATFIVFGAGKIGRRLIETFHLIGMKPLAVIDNDSRIWGDEICDSLIISPDNISEYEYDYVLIAVKNCEEIYNQLLDLKVADSKIIHVPSALKLIEQFLSRLAKDFSHDEGNKKTIEYEKVLFDLSNGLAIGGVENWSINSSVLLNEDGKKCFLVVNEDKTKKCEADGVLQIGYNNQGEFHDYINNILSIFVREKPCVLICNFVSYFLWAAVIAKIAFSSEIDLVVVQHSDDSTYYNGFGLYNDYIDSYLYVSDKIEHLLKKRNEGCIYRKVTWGIETAKGSHRDYSSTGEELKVGYAGRITTVAKRCDLLLETIKKVKERKLKIHFYIAGEGDYLPEMIEEITQNDLTEYVDVLGAIEHGKIMEFWHDKDVYYSCSDYEGHSISQCEAMAAGVVPVVTNVSGAEDDIVNEINGIIVDLGDVDMALEALAKLQGDKGLLTKMGKSASETIEKKYSYDEAMKFWKEIL